MRPNSRSAFTTVLFGLCAWLVLGLGTAQAADRARIEAFMQTTGFDVALDSIRLSADSAPEMLGLEAADFGAAWSGLVREVFDTALMHDMALDILEQTLSDDLLTHAADFYASDLGQRLVVAENASHMLEDEELKAESGAAIVDGLVRIGSPRVAGLRRLILATDSTGNAVRAIQEVQVRFLMAAAGAGVIDLQMDENDLRERLGSEEGAMRLVLQTNALANAAYTYQAFSDAELAAYVDALENDQMRLVYELMNAVQFEIMANRFEAVARGLTALQPSQDL